MPMIMLEFNNFSVGLLKADQVAHTVRLFRSLINLVLSYDVLLLSTI